MIVLLIVGVNSDYEYKQEIIQQMRDIKLFKRILDNFNDPLIILNQLKPLFVNKKFMMMNEKAGNT